MMKKVKNIDPEIESLIGKIWETQANLTDIESWRLFYNQYNPKDYDYFTGIQGKDKDGQTIRYKYPAKFRWIPVVRKNMNVLITTQELRPFVYDINVIDQPGMNRKFQNKAIGMATWMIQEYKSYEENYLNKLEMLNQQVQQATEILSKEPESKQEAEQQQMLKIQMPFITNKVKVLQDQIENLDIFNKKRIEKVEKYFLYDAKDIVEEIAQKLALKIMKSTSFKEESNKCFTSRIVTGKPYYYVNHDPGNKNVTIKHIDEFSVHYPSISGIRWIQELPWVVIKERWSYNDIIRVYGHLLSNDEIKDLKKSKKRLESNPVFVPIKKRDGADGEGAILYQNAVGYNGEYDDESIEVARVWYVKERKLYARISPNKYNPARPHIHFVNEENIKNNPIRSARGERLETRYLQERYYGIVINGEIKLGFEKDEIQPRDTNNLSKVYLPIIGKVNGNITDKPVSLIQDTKDLNELYQVINYHKELYIAVSGVKGQIIDLSQKPKDMTLAEHQYHEKNGRLYIKTTNAYGKSIGGSYNQWKSYDNTISPAINNLENMLINIDESLGLIMGVPRQKVGQTVSTDQVGTNEQAVSMANLVTETYHYNHDLMDCKALEMAVNIHMNHLLKPNELISVPNPTGTSESIFKVPEFDHKNSQVNIYVENNKKEQDSRMKIEQLAVLEYQKGLMPFNVMTKVYTMESVKELQKELDYYSKEAQKLQQESAQSAQQAEAQKAQLEREVDLTIAQMDVQAKMAELEFLREKMTLENELKREEIGSKEGLELTKAATERQTEATYLAEQNRASTVDEQLELLRIQLDAILREKELALNKELGEKKHSEAMAKAKSVSTKKKVKEKVRD